MSQVIRIPGHVYKRLESKAKGFDTPAGVIEKLLDFYDQHNLNPPSVNATSLHSASFLTKSSSDETRRTNRKSDTREQQINNRRSDGIVKFEHLDPKAQGQVRRDRFKDMINCKGIQLFHDSGVIYKTKENKIVGIASASESVVKPGTWFLGLPPQEFYTIVLLCGNKKTPLFRSDMFSIIPSNEFVKNYVRKLSRDANGQIKFHIIQTAGKLYLNIPKQHEVDQHDVEVGQFVDKHENLRSEGEPKDAAASQIRKRRRIVKNVHRTGHSALTEKSSSELRWIREYEFDNSNNITLKHIYTVLFFMKSGCTFSEATKAALKVFTSVRDYQTISDKCARRFAGSVDNFVYMFNTGKVLDELAIKFDLSQNDYNVFKVLLKK